MVWIARSGATGQHGREERQGITVVTHVRRMTAGVQASAGTVPVGRRVAEAILVRVGIVETHVRKEATRHDVMIFEVA